MQAPNGKGYLAESPICLGGEHQKAKDYVYQIRKAMDQDGWTQRQRTRLSYLLRIWTLRSKGWDARFETHGTFGWGDGARRPTIRDVMTETHRRQEAARVRATGVNVLQRIKQIKAQEQREDREEN
jgi:hypothetical protein